MKNVVSTTYKILNPELNKGISHELDFLKHFAQYSKVLSEFKQNEEQKASFYKQLIIANYNNETITPTQISAHIVKNQADEVIARAFINRALIAVKHLQIQNYKEKEKMFVLEMNTTRPAEFEELADFKKTLIGVPIQKNPFFEDGIRALAAALEKSALTMLLTICNYVDLSEIITWMAASQKVSIVLGFKLFSCLYNSFCEPGSFKIYLEAVKGILIGPEMPLGNKIMMIIEPVRPLIIPILCSCLGLFIGNSYGSFTHQIVEVTKGMTKEISDLERYIPNDSIRASIQWCYMAIGGSFFSIGRAISTARDGFGHGILGNYFDHIRKFTDKLLEEYTKKKIS